MTNRLTGETWDLSQRWVGRGLCVAWHGGMPYYNDIGFGNGISYRTMTPYGWGHLCNGTNAAGAVVTPVRRPRAGAGAQSYSGGVLIRQFEQNYNNGSSWFGWESIGAGMSLNAATTSASHGCINTDDTWEYINSSTGFYDPLNDTKWHWMEVKRSGTTVHLLMDGVIKHTGTMLKTPKWSATSRFAMAGMFRGAGYDTARMYCAFGYYFDRYIADTSEIRANPSTLFEKRGSRMLYAPAAAPGGTFQAAWARQRSGVVSAGGSI